MLCDCDDFLVTLQATQSLVHEPVGPCPGLIGNEYRYESVHSKFAVLHRMSQKPHTVSRYTAIEVDHRHVSFTKRDW